jgi:hypothetical protein
VRTNIAEQIENSTVPQQKETLPPKLAYFIYGVDLGL